MSQYKRMENPMFNPVSAPDYLPPEKLRELQTERFAFIIRRAYENVPFYRKRMDDKNVKPEDFRTLDDVKKLPFTIKADLRDTYPFGLFASPLKDIVRLHASSGTTGKPIVVAYTKSDLDVWQETMMRTMAAAGVSKDTSTAFPKSPAPASARRASASADFMSSRITTIRRSSTLTRWKSCRTVRRASWC